MSNKIWGLLKELEKIMEKLKSEIGKPEEKLKTKKYTIDEVIAYDDH